MSTKILLTMPQPGETITEGTVIRWIASVGDFIKEGEPIVELETEKAVFEYESPYEGTLVEILAAEGKSVLVGNPIAVFEVSDDKASTYFMLGIGKKVGGQKSEVRGQKKKQAVVEGEAKVSPMIRHIMQEYEITMEELSRVRGTGPRGRITKENILKYLKSKRGEVSEEEDVEIVPCSPIRLRIAENMARSKATIPHAHTSLSIDMTQVVESRNRLKEKFKKKHGISLGILPLVFPSLKSAIKKYPHVNASFREEKGKKMIAIHKKINLGVAVDTIRGLFIPVIYNAEKKDSVGFAKEMEGAIDRATQNKLRPSDLTGMTFTFNNYGFYGTTIGVQIILPPQSTTLGMGRIEARPWVKDGNISIRHVAEFTMAFDHRVMDGREAGLFLLDLKKSLENFSEPGFL